MNQTNRLIIALTALIAISVPVIAHHSAAAYDTQQELKVTGTIKQYIYKNPHVYLSVEVKKDDGSISVVEVEAGAPSVLNPLGFTKDSLKVGELVTVVGNPNRTSDKAMLGKDLIKKDGSYL